MVFTLYRVGNGTAVMHSIFPGTFSCLAIATAAFLPARPQFVLSCVPALPRSQSHIADHLNATSYVIRDAAASITKFGSDLLSP
jgi:hypothetical protein